MLNRRSELEKTNDVLINNKPDSPNRASAGTVVRKAIGKTKVKINLKELG